MIIIYDSGLGIGMMIKCNKQQQHDVIFFHYGKFLTINKKIFEHQYLPGPARKYAASKKILRHLQSIN